MVAMYMGVTLRAHLVRGESHIQGNDNRGVATVPKAKFCWISGFVEKSNSVNISVTGDYY